MKLDIVIAKPRQKKKADRTAQTIQIMIWQKYRVWSVDDQNKMMISNLVRKYIVYLKKNWY